MSEHQPVMVAEVLEALKLNIKNNSNNSSEEQHPSAGNFIDGTFGRGGHSKAILAQLNEQGRLLSMDKDPDVKPYTESLAKNDPRFFFQQGSYTGLLDFCKSLGLVGKIDGILLDLGVSSPQLNQAERGFSFTHDGPLDMRMDPNTGISAAEWINNASEEEIDEILKTFGEERFHRRIAHAIITARENSPIITTKALAGIISRAHPAWERHKHPATRSFQAIRIFINHEFDELSLVLDQSLKLLKPGGRLAVISFHSLEDRIVKRFIQTHERGDEHPRGLPILQSELKQKLRRVGGAQKPSEAEIAKNIRARSATLRVAERVGD